ncbi:MAG TPA: Rieske 2Fe-2S domain-containing protein [Steroidobacteraceae bacterium]|nr:Rieske 2Fe-2S domain-containing protein [Steroidobacteraceae bacterium]
MTSAHYLDTPFKRALSDGVPGEGQDGLYTQSWYPICFSSAANAHFVRGFDFLGGRVIAFRDGSGRAHVMSAYCPHMGADLSIGDMVDGNVRCVFHHWQYGSDGRCVKVPSGAAPPRAARLFEFPTQEKYGILWAYNGTHPHYELPDLPYPDSELVFKARVFGQYMPVDPWILCANTPDMQHIRYLHGITIDGENPHRAVQWTDHSLRYSFSGTHTTGEPVKHQVGIFGTSMYYQTTDFAGRWFGFVAPFGLPKPGHSQVYFVVCARKSMGTPQEIDEFLEHVLDLETHVVLEDMHNMQTIRFRPGTLTGEDLTLGRFFDYLRKYPRANPAKEFIF